jgi:hypothetical protein
VTGVVTERQLKAEATFSCRSALKSVRDRRYKGESLPNCASAHFSGMGFVSTNMAAGANVVGRVPQAEDVVNAPLLAL